MANSKKKRVKIGQMTESTSSSGGVQKKIRVVIPDDLIFEILMRLPAKSVGRFRCVSRSLLSITTNPSFITAHTQHNRIALQSIMIEGLEEREPHWIHSLYLASADANPDAGITLRKLPQIKIFNGGWFLNSCDGLILFFAKQVGLHCIINPLTGNSISLSWTSGRFSEFLGFYFHRSTSTYRLLGPVGHHNTDVFVVGKSNWRRIRCPRPAFLKNYHSVDVKGNLNWLSWKERGDLFITDRAPPDAVMTFDKEAEVYNLLPLPPTEHLYDRGGSLMDFNGELGLWVVSDDGIIDFWIMKECWMKKYSVYHPDLEGCPRSINTSIVGVWQLGFAISINDEELFIGISAFIKPQYFVRWNLKSGTCLVQKVEDYSSRLFVTFPYIETLVGHSFSSLRPCTRAWKRRAII